MNLTGCEIRFVLLGQMAEWQSGALRIIGQESSREKAPKRSELGER
jgi:hypothetical protein